MVDNLSDEDEAQPDVDPEGVPFKPKALDKGGYEGNNYYLEPDGTILDAEGDGDDEDINGNVIGGEEIA